MRGLSIGGGPKQRSTRSAIPCEPENGYRYKFTSAQSSITTFILAEVVLGFPTTLSRAKGSVRLSCRSVEKGQTKNGETWYLLRELESS